jgi:hypothetical protein
MCQPRVMSARYENHCQRQGRADDRQQDGQLTEDDMREALILLLKAEHDLHHDNDGIFKHRRALRSLECVGEAIRLLQEELEERRLACIAEARKVALKSDVKQ